MKEFGFIHMAVRPDEQIGLHEHPEWEISGQSEKPVAILAPVFSTMHTIWTV